MSTEPVLDSRSWLAINAIRTLAMDAVEQAKSGHPGTPMALAPVGHVLWTRHLKHAPTDPEWADRDRFVLSCGHASMLLYGLLHLSGYELSLDDIKRFRQWGSKTPGHPERGHPAGTEVTTGPLGQGVGNAVGMAMAERFLAQRFNRKGHRIVDHRTWALVSDGDVMEGVASEAASLAGHLRLDKLTLIYDDNRITIDGRTDLTFSEDVGLRFEAYGWQVLRVADGNDLAAIDRALTEAKSETERPTLIVLRTIIADPAPTKRDRSEAHGAPLGAEEIARTKAVLSWPAEPFSMPEETEAQKAASIAAGEERLADWQTRLDAYRAAFPALAAELDRWLGGPLELDDEAELPAFGAGDAMATRQASHKALKRIATLVPNLVGGSADLAGSTGVDLGPDACYFGPGVAGQSVAWGIREHAMAAAMNGMAAHGGVRPYGSTFLVFADYMKPAIRLAALMHLPTIYLFTHDSIGVGEDGPTHQPIEQLAMLRSIPNLTVLRPADAAETVEAWRVALARQDGPTAIVLTRQKVPGLPRRGPVAEARQGGYVLFDPPVAPAAAIIATGSEVQLALAAALNLSEHGVPTRVVSLPSWERFAAQPKLVQDAVLPPSLRTRVSVEAATTFGWHRWTTDHGRAIGLDHFGASAPGDRLFVEFGLTADRVIETVKQVVEERA